MLAMENSYFEKKPLWFYQKILWNMLEFLIDNIFAMFGGRVFQQTAGIPICSSSHRLVPLFVWGKLYTGSSQEKRKEASQIL
jgi:hypothetical protein